MCNSKKVITDSGGLQKEAYFAKVQALVLMEDTAWRELVEIQWNQLVDDKTDKIVEKAVNHDYFLEIKENLYGSGNAGKNICDILLSGNS